MLIAYVAVDLDGTPALQPACFPTDDGGDACSEWLAECVDRDEDGGALAVLAIVGKPGERFEVKQDGVTVAVVVRA